MSKTTDGGPVYPVGIFQFQGMSLRDLFAAAALAGLATQQEALMSNCELLSALGTAGIDKLQANKAYRLADAMLAERNK